MYGQDDKDDGDDDMRERERPYLRGDSAEVISSDRVQSVLLLSHKHVSFGGKQVKRSQKSTKHLENGREKDASKPGE